MTKPHTLGVYLHSTLVATLTDIGHDRSLFAFTENYIDDAQRATLSLSFRDAMGALMSEPKNTQTQLTPFFSNLLPEGPMRTYLAKRANVHSGREFFLLWVLGQDLPGALTIKPLEGEALPTGLADGDDQSPPGEGPMRFSLAGVQLKFSATQAASGGLTIPASGMGGSWIIKLPSSQYPLVPENEFAMMTLARKIGIDVPDIKLINVNDIEGIPASIGKLGKKAFAIKRFDRTHDGGSVHIEDFAQIYSLYPRDKYTKGRMRNIAQVINIETGDADNAEFIRRLVFNTLIGNADMHMKNWSLIYPDGIRPRLAPAYDFVSTIPYIPDHESALKVSRSKAFADFTLDEIAHMASKASMPEKTTLDTAKETSARFRALWMQEKGHLGLSSEIERDIDRHLSKLPVW